MMKMTCRTKMNTIIDLIDRPCAQVCLLVTQFARHDDRGREMRGMGPCSYGGSVPEKVNRMSDPTANRAISMPFRNFGAAIPTFCHYIHDRCDLRYINLCERNVPLSQRGMRASQSEHGRS